MNAVAWDRAHERVVERCQDRIIFGHSDMLIDIKVPRSAERGLHWDRWVYEYHPDIVIINTELPSMHAFNHTLMRVVEGMRRFPNVQFLWQSQGPAGCAEGPLANWSEYSAPAMVRARRPYNWALFDAFDELARHVWEGPARPLNFAGVLDLSPLLLRPDAHVQGPSNDCRHLCTPGPFALLPQLLTHVLGSAHFN